VLLSVADAGLIRPVWQEVIEDEVRRNSIRLSISRGSDYSAAEAAADVVKVNMNRAFPGACLEPPDWIRYVGDCTNHPKDRHVLAVAIGGRASHVVTNNIRDFPVPSRPPGIGVVRPDTFLVGLLMTDTAGVVGAIETMVRRHKKPPHTPAELASKIAAGQTMPRFGAELVRVLHG
jgi:hypothetical protein